MQAVYSYEVARLANFELAKEVIREKLEPDWIEKKHITNAQVNAQKKQATRFFVENAEKTDYILPSELNIRVKKAVVEGTNLYRNNTEQDLRRIKNNLGTYIDRIYHIYLLSLNILGEFAKYVETEKRNYEEKKQFKKEDIDKGNFNLAQNKFIKTVVANQKLESEAIRLNLNWHNQRASIKSFFDDIVNPDEAYRKYNRSSNTSFEEDKRMTEYLMREMVFKKNTFNTYVLEDFLMPSRVFEKSFKYDSTERVIEDTVKFVLEVWQDFTVAFGLEKVSVQTKQFEEKINKKAREFATKYASSDFEKPAEKEVIVLEKQVSKSIKTTKNFSRICFQIFVEQASSLLDKYQLNHPDQQNQVLTALEEAFNTFFDKIGLAKQIEHIKVSIKTIPERRTSNIIAYFSEMDLFWNEDSKVVQSMTQKTLKSVKEGSSNFELSQLSSSWQDDEFFYKDLLENSLKHSKAYEDIINENSDNWDITRITLVDKILLKVAITEMIHCPSIPIKVSINEYVELAKNYSTDKSKNFINGMLDAISVDLKAKGLIKKSGRGLFDNK